MTLEATDATSRTASQPNDWRNLLSRAASEAEVLSLALDYLATWSPEEIAQLPVDCRPGRLRDADDISQYAFHLATTHCGVSSGGDTDEALDRMLVFMTQAAVRLAHVKAARAE